MAASHCNRAALLGLCACAALLVLSCQTPAAISAARSQAAPSPSVERLEQERADPTAFASMLATPEPKVRARVVLALARLEHRRAEPHLAVALGDADPSVREAAAFGMGQLDLALDSAVADHEAARTDAEKLLVDALDRETTPAVQQALVRALGRLSAGKGLDALVALAASPGPLRAEALTALGVSGARRRSSRTNDAVLADAVARGLVDGQETVRAAAAYAAFRQRLRVPSDAARTALASADSQVRIFLLRSAGAQEEQTAALLVDAGLVDADWRVRVEALRAAASRPDSVSAAAVAVQQAVARLSSGGTGALGHLVSEGCTALAASGAAPSLVKPALQQALVSLAGNPAHRAAACTCAVALDVVAPGGNSIERCDVDADDAALDELRVRVLASARIPDAERIAGIARLLRDGGRKVRMVAVAALSGIGGSTAAAAAAAQLETEEDAGVASALFEIFSDGENADALSDAALAAIAERFRGGSSFEQLEPVVAVARIVRGRETQAAGALRDELARHAELRVRDAAAGVPAGDREPGPRASVIPAPPLGTMPLYAVVKTSRGDVRIAFERELAAATVANFAALARANVYDGTPFHRVVPDFVAQGGDPRGDGTGGPGYTIACENSDAAFTRGAVGMATSGKDTGGSQFFFTHSWQPHLDGRYTLFARVVHGQDVVDALQPGDVIRDIDFLLAAPKR